MTPSTVDSDVYCKHCAQKRPRSFPRGRRIVYAALCGMSVGEIACAEGTRASNVIRYLNKHGGTFEGGVFVLSGLTARTAWALTDKDLASTGADYWPGMDQYQRTIGRGRGRPRRDAGVEQ